MPDVLHATKKLFTIFFTMAVFLFAQNTSFAATTGQVYPSLGTTVAESPWLDNTWTTPTNIYSDDAATANVTAASYDIGAQTYVLKATGFNFSAIPDGSTINGITARINAFYRATKGAGSMDLCQLLDISRTKVGTNKCSTPVVLSSVTSTIITQGSASDLWGNALTSAWVKDPDFGIAMGIIATADNTDVDVDYVSLEITYTPPTNTTTISNLVAAEPGNSTIAPGASALVDSFGLVASAGTDTVTGATVTLAVGTGARVATVTITNNGDTITYCSATPSGDTATLTGCGIPVSTTNTQFKIKITAISHTHISMPAPPGGSYAVTSRVTAFTSTNTQAGTDSGSSTVTIDNLSPGATSGANATGGNTQVTVGWTNPADGDFQKVIIYCKTSSITETPTEGTDPAVDGTTCDGTARVKYSGSISPQIFSGLTNGVTYYFRIYARDTNGNFTAIASTQQVSATPSPSPITTLGNGTDPGNSSITPSGVATMAGAFTFITNTGTDPITAVVVGLATGTSGGLSLVEVTNDAGLVVYGSIANPGSDTPSISLSLSGLTATTGSTQYKIRITPKSHASMPLPSGSTYSVTAKINSWTGTNPQAGSDTAGTTVTIDNASPANVTSATGSAGNAQVTTSWTNPADSDFHSTVVLRRATSAVADVPVEGTTYAVGNTIGTATVACVIATPTATCVDAGLTNGVTYHYKIFSKDSNGNYAATGVVPAGSPFTPSLSTFTITSSTGTGGTISPLGATNIAQGSSQSYTLIPDLGYDVASLTVDGSSAATSSPYTYVFGNVQSNHTIAVTFIQVTPTYTITSTAGTNGTISPLGATILLQGASQTYTIAPTSGYVVDTLVVDSVSIATSTSHTFTTITANHTIDVTFSLIPPPPGSFAITATAGANGSVIPTGVAIVTQGNNQSYAITPDSGYNIATLTIDSVSVATSTAYTFTNVQTNHTIDATFVALPPGARQPDIGPTRPTTVTFSGKAFPGGKISVINKQLNIEKVVGQDTITDADGSFEISFIGVLQALHSFGIIAKDSVGRSSQSKFFFVDTISDDLTAKDLLLPPTSALKGTQITRGTNAVILGSAVPGYTIHLELDGILIEDMLASKDGTYKFEIPTGTLEFGTHTLRTRQSDPLAKKRSDFSISRTLTISRLVVVQADLNSDSKIDIRDWSIFLSLWGSKSATGRTRIDFNTDGKVDIADFSIFIKTIRKK